MPKRPRACSHLLPHHRGEDWHWRHEQRGLECLRDPVRWYLGWYCHAGRDVGTRGGGCRCHHGSLMEQKHGGGVEQHDRRGGVFVARCGRSDARSDLTNLDPMIAVPEKQNHTDMSVSTFLGKSRKPSFRKAALRQPAVTSRRPCHSCPRRLGQLQGFGPPD